ncbi:MAG: recombinase family protein [Candidatus Limnocylindrales bacterium]
MHAGSAGTTGTPPDDGSHGWHRSPQLSLLTRRGAPKAAPSARFHHSAGTSAGAGPQRIARHRDSRARSEPYARAATRSAGALAAHLNAEGKRRVVRARDAAGAIADVERPWTKKGIVDIIRRADFYLGRVVYRRGARTFAGTHPAIITAEQAQAAEPPGGPALL